MKAVIILYLHVQKRVQVTYQTEATKWQTRDLNQV